MIKTFKKHKNHGKICTAFTKEAPHRFEQIYVNNFSRVGMTAVEHVESKRQEAQALVKGGAPQKESPSFCSTLSTGPLGVPEALFP